MKKKGWKVTAVVAFLIAAVFLVMLAGIYIRRQHAKDLYQGMQKQNETKAEQEVSESESSTGKRLDIPVDFETLQKENPDIYAWITIPGTQIDYPVVQDPEDDSFYLDHAADRTESDSGAIYSEKANSKDFEDYLTVLYGHNMKDGSMFAGLHAYEDKKYLEEHTDLTVYTPDAILHYKIFAAYLTDNRHVLDYYNQGKDADSRKAYIKDIFGQRTMDASINSKAPVDENSKILTLSTCHRAGKTYRYLVQAYLVEKTG